MGSAWPPAVPGLWLAWQATSDFIHGLSNLSLDCVRPCGLESGSE